MLAEQQFGFRKLHSTEYAAVKLIDHVAKQIESGLSNQHIDFSKGFDILSLEILLNKLKHYGIIGS